MSPPAFWVTTGTSCASVDANDLERIGDALKIFSGNEGPATLIILDTHIGYARRIGRTTAAAHGERWPGRVQAHQTRVRLARGRAVPRSDGVREHFAAGSARVALRRGRAWNARSTSTGKYPSLATEVEHMQKRTLPDGWTAICPRSAGCKRRRGRDASARC